MKTQIYDPVLHGQVPPHLQAAVLLAGGKIDKITMSGAQHEGPTALRLTLDSRWGVPTGLVDGKTDGTWVLYFFGLPRRIVYGASHQRRGGGYSPNAGDVKHLT